MWVKLCANTSLNDARLCAAAGADAVGFVFARGSKRMVTLAEVAPISRQLADEFPRVERVGVFTEGPAASLAEVVRSCALTTVQLQGDAALIEAAALRDLLPEAKIIAAFAWAGAADFARRLESGEHDRLMVDASVAKSAVGSTMLGGTGATFDWQQAGSSFAIANARGVEAIAAGGLTPENVTEAITILQPWGVDVATGVELEPGKKDSGKVARFVAAARLAKSS
jgi:phosphoribosylanthranilate isomerase